MARNNFNQAARVMLALAAFIWFFTLIHTGLDPDFGWHLRIGNEILASGQVPRTDDLTYSMTGHEWVDHEWLINAGLAYAYSHNLDIFVELLFAIMVSAPFVFWIVGARHWTTFIAVFCAICALSPYIFIRVAVISFFLFWLLYGHLNQSFWTRYEHKMPFYWNYYWQLVIFFIIWANLHAGFIQGIFLLGMFMVYDHGRRLFYEHKIKWELGINDTLVMAGCLAAGVINPYGIGLYQEALRIMQSAESHMYINEWLPIFLVQAWEPLVFITPLVVLIIAFRKKLPEFHVFLAVVYLFLTFSAARNLMQLVIVGTVLLASGLRLYCRQLKCAGKYCFAGIMITGTILILWIQIATLNERDPGNKYPLEAVKILSEKAETQNIVLFNDYSWGGYIEWKLPEVKTLIDGRMPHWKIGNWSLLQDYIDVYYKQDEPKFLDMCNKWGINTVLIINGSDMEKMLVKYDWKVIYRDKISLIMEKY